MWRIPTCSLSLLLASAIAVADEKKSVIRVLDVKVEGASSAKFGDPTVIADAEQLAKAIKDEAAVTAVKKAVDFSKEQVLYFAWSGSGQDKVAAEAGKGADVVFTYTRGRTRDVRAHHKLFAVPRDAKVKVIIP